VILAGGTTAGPGNFTITVGLTIQPSDGGNTNIFIQSHVVLLGSASIPKSVYVLLSGPGNLDITQSSTLSITATTNFGLQAGNPVVTVSGIISVSLPVGGTVYANVNFLGSGSLAVVSGTVIFQADVINIGAISIGSGGLVEVDTALINAGPVTGTGSLNVTASPNPSSSFGSISLNYFGVPNGNILITSIAVNTFEIWNGAITLSSGSSNTANTFHFYGGNIIGNAKIAARSLTIQGTIPQVLNQVVVTTGTLALSCATACSVLTQNGASISAGSTIFSPPVQTPGKLTIQD